MQMEGSDIVNYGDTICVVGGFDELTKMARKSVSCWNPLQIGGDPDEEDGDLEEGRNKTTTKGDDFNNFVLQVLLRFKMFLSTHSLIFLEKKCVLELKFLII